MVEVAASVTHQIPPCESFSAYRFYREASSCCSSAIERSLTRASRSLLEPSSVCTILGCGICFRSRPKCLILVDCETRADHAGMTSGVGCISGSVGGVCFRGTSTFLAGYTVLTDRPSIENDFEVISLMGVFRYNACEVVTGSNSQASYY